MTKNSCDSELQKYLVIKSSTFAHISNNYSITVLDLESKSTEEYPDSFYISVKYKRDDNKNIDFTSIDYLKTYYIQNKS